jgi:kinesin family protein 2/24
MNEYQLENKLIYHDLVAGFKPQGKANNSVSSDATLDIRDTVIGVRIRPILPDEAAVGHVAGVCPRKAGVPVVDIHEFRPHVRSKPRLDVRSSYEGFEQLLKKSDDKLYCGHSVWSRKKD